MLLCEAGSRLCLTCVGPGRRRPVSISRVVVVVVVLVVVVVVGRDNIAQRLHHMRRERAGASKAGERREKVEEHDDRQSDPPFMAIKHFDYTHVGHVLL